MGKTTVQEIIVGIIAQKEALDITNQQIADLSKMSKSTVDRVLRNDAGINPSAQALFDIADAVGYKIGEAPPEDPAIQRVINLYEARIRQTELQSVRTQDRQNRWLRGVAIFTGIVVLLVFIMLFYDMANPNVGWVRR